VWLRATRPRNLATEKIQIPAIRWSGYLLTSSAAIGTLECLLDPVARTIANPPIDDEPLTAADEKALAEAREWSKHNKGIPHEEFLAELGIL
jgi:hypothetical protein